MRGSQNGAVNGAAAESGGEARRGISRGCLFCKYKIGFIARRNVVICGKKMGGTPAAPVALPVFLRQKVLRLKFCFRKQGPRPGADWIRCLARRGADVTAAARV
jgi:hypothetical protein